MRLREKYQIKVIKLDDIWVDNVAEERPQLIQSFSEEEQKDAIKVAVTSSEKRFNGKPYRIVNGRNRIAAGRKLGHTEILAIIDHTIKSDYDLSLNALIANTGRSNKWDEACHIMTLAEKGLKVEDISKKIGMSTGYVSERMNLRTKLCDEMANALSKGEMKVTAAIQASKLPIKKQVQLFNDGVKSVKGVTAEVKKQKTAKTQSLFDTIKAGEDEDHTIDVGYTLSPKDIQNLIEGVSIEIVHNGSSFFVSKNV